MIHIGVDMHRRFSQVAVLDDAGEIVREERLEHRDRARLEGFFGHYSGRAVAAFEATRNWYWLYDLMEAQGVAVKLVHPLRVRLIAQARIKTDKIDARILAQLERTGFLPEAHIPPPEVREQREWLRYRVALVRTRAGYKNRVHAVLDKLGVSHEYTDLFGKRGLDFLMTVELPEVFRYELSEYLDIIYVPGIPPRASRVRGGSRGPGRGVHWCHPERSEGSRGSVLPQPGRFFTAFRMTEEVPRGGFRPRFRR